MTVQLSPEQGGEKQEPKTLAIYVKMRHNSYTNRLAGIL